ncbi:unnamed protein product [Plutella xylostella]|uniref:(diamondback moth) hypothetical protein n=1 Tax=Plutella xylostella TaxID=51655 RepID=A0A8S4DY32_PLUXY|nr:unnamed protein product [Plutella xylostella]
MFVCVCVLQACDSDGGGGTLRRMCVWAQEPLHRLTWLANIAHTAHHKKVAPSDGGGGTLRRMCVWAQEPLHRLTWLTNIAHTAHHKKGGIECKDSFVHWKETRAPVVGT